MAAVDQPGSPTSIPWGVGIVAAGLLALIVRPLVVRQAADPRLALLVLFVLLGGAGAFWPLPRSTMPPAVPPALVAVVGVGAFAAGRAVAGPALSVPLVAAPLLLNALAAVAEEAFFRRLLFGLLAPLGPSTAIAGSAVAFAAIHVSVWGPGVLPLDLAAGLVLSWQRAATGSWATPAVTHVAANLLAAL